MHMCIYDDGGGRDSILKEMRTKGMEEMEVVMKRFGDEQSTLLDRFERLSFEVKLNQAILGRSLSEPRALPTLMPPPPPTRESTVTKGLRHHYYHRGLGFQKVLKKLFKPIFGSRKEERKEEVLNQKNFKFIKAFSRSLRF